MKGISHNLKIHTGMC